MSKSRGHHRHEEHEEHEEHVNHEAWVIPYADMLTLLMALFLVLFAVGRTDLEKFKKLSESFRNEFGGESSKPVSLGGTGEELVGSGGGGILSGDASAHSTSTTTTISPADQALVEKEAAQAAAQDAIDSLGGVEQAVQQAADVAGLGDSVGLTIDARGLIVTIVTDQVLFASGSADLAAAGVPILDVVAQALAAVPNDISIEGHTDSRPISNSRYRSNWELSTARATSVLQYLLLHGIDAKRMTPAGHGDTMPVGDNATVEGAAQNRRVEIIVKATVSLDPVFGTTTTAVIDPEVTIEIDPGAAPDGAATDVTEVASQSAPAGSSEDGATTETGTLVTDIVPPMPGTVNGTPKGGTEDAGSGQ